MTARQWALLLLLGLIWGASFFFIEVLLGTLHPFALVLARLVPAVLVLLLWCLWRGLALPNGARDWANLALMGLLNNALPFVLIAVGQVTVTGGLASILNASTAFFGVLVGAVLLADEPLRSHRVAGVLVGIAGVAVVVGPGALGSLSAANIGQLLVLAASFSYALASAWGRRRLGHLPPAVSSLGMLATASVMMLLVVLATGTWPAPPATVWQWPVLFSVLGLSVLGTAVAYLLYFHLLQSAGAGNLLLVTVVVPVFAVALDAAVLGQFVGPRQGLGFLVVLAGLLVMDGRVLRR